MLKQLLFASTSLWMVSTLAAGQTAETWGELLPAEFDRSELVGGIAGQLLLPINANDQAADPRQVRVVSNADGQVHWIFPESNSTAAPAATTQDIRLDLRPPKITLLVSEPSTYLDGNRWLVAPGAQLSAQIQDGESGMAEQQAQVGDQLIRLPFEVTEQDSLIHLSATDQAGNHSHVSASLLQDNAGPLIEWSVSNPPAAGTPQDPIYRSPVNLQISAADLLSQVDRIEIQADGSSQTINQPARIRIRGDSAQITSWDALGNQSTVLASWTYDTDPPQIIVDPAVTRRGNHYQVFVGEPVPVSITDPSGVKIAEFAHQYESQPFEGFVLARRTGLYRARIRVVDSLGNEAIQTLLFDARRRP